MNQRPWVDKTSYQTRLVADEQDLSCAETEVQMVRFKKGKFSHFHKRKTEFFYFTKGEGTVVIKGQTIALKPGTELLVKPNTPHEFVNEDTIPLEAVMFKTNSQSDDTFKS